MDADVTGPTTLQQRFKDVMAGVCTPVSVVTSVDADTPYGTTVSAFTSLSLEPPMVLVALDQRSDLLAVLRRSGRFGLNVLADRQADLAMTFARKGGGGKFDGVRWHDDGGVPRLPGTTGFLRCDVTELVAGGDHVIVLGEVRHADSGAGAPLTYHRRAFGTHRPVEEP
jgi:flavin reductase (DIM6/NTAB) family NADH-FMN oxidoreductase RutF